MRITSMKTLNLFLKRIVLTTGIILSLMITSSAGSYTSSIQSDSLPPGTWGYGSCRSDISFLTWCDICPLLDIVHPHVIIEHTDLNGQKTIYDAKGFHPADDLTAAVHLTKVLAYHFAQKYVHLASTYLTDWIAEKLGIDRNSWLYSVIAVIVFNRIAPKPVDSRVDDEMYKHPDDVFDCEIKDENKGLKYSDSRLQGVLHRMTNPNGFKYHFVTFNSQHWAYWVINNEHWPIPLAIGI